MWCELMIKEILFFFLQAFGTWVLYKGCDKDDKLLVILGSGLVIATLLTYIKITTGILI